MVTMNATEVRKEWSTVVDSVIREKPQFIKRTRDYMWLSNIDIMETILSAYKFTAKSFVESDHSVTLSLNEIDLVENAETEEKAKLQLAKAILDYATDYYEDFGYWSSAPNRKEHIPYIFKALILSDFETIGEGIQCQSGKN